MKIDKLAMRKAVLIGSVFVLLFATLSIRATHAEGPVLQAPRHLRIPNNIPKPPPERIRVILDTDANNELDDQHAIAYMLFNSDIFEVEGITTNRTSGGGGINNHVAEADRVVRMCGYESHINIYQGASGSYDSIKGDIHNPTFDGHEAVNFIIQRAHADSSRPLVLLPIGKLTNIALALLKDPSIAPNIRVVWLGSHWPQSGEYNLVNDVTAVNPILDMPEVEFEICPVRPRDSIGTAAVTVHIDDIRQKLPGQGPQVAPPVPGRSGGVFTNFGDYSVDLFNHMGNSVRALFDVAAVAIVKNPSWAEKRVVGAPRLNGESWKERHDNPRKITFWENFNRDAIIGDFFETMHSPVTTGR